MGYFLRARGDIQDGLQYRIVDSRGPWFIGASPLCVCGAAVYLAQAALALVVAGCSSRPCLAHVNITGRGSTIRKLILLTVARAFGVRYVLHLHDYDYAAYYRGQGAFFQRRIATAFRHAAMVLVLSRRDREVIAQLFDLPSERIAILHNAVPDPAAEVNRRRLPGEPCHLLFLGYLSERKGAAGSYCGRSPACRQRQRLARDTGGRRSGRRLPQARERSRHARSSGSAGVG